MTVTPLTTVAARGSAVTAGQPVVPAGVVDSAGNLGVLGLDSSGALKVAPQTGRVTTVTGAQASLATTVASTYVMDVAKAAVLAVTFTSSVTAGGVLILEGSIDGVNWSSLTSRAMYSNGSTFTGTLTTLAASTTYVYEADVVGYVQVRLRVTTALGAQLAALGYSTAATGTATVAIAGTPTISGTVTATPATPSTTTTLTTASTNATAVKASAGTLYGLVISNPTATACYLRLYNKASAPVPASDSALVMATILVPASSTVNPNLGALGLRFSTGIAFTVTGAIADTDATNAVAGARVLSAYI